MNSWVVKVRSLARRTGLIGWIKRVRPVGEYESRVHEALAGAVKPGDVVWDVGANVGLYTEQFCQWVGEDGFVVAFEPWVESCKRIEQRLPNCARLRVENVALSDTDTTGQLVTGADSVENHILSEADASNVGASVVAIEICRGDTACKRLGRVPNVIKVDVEGFEEEVLQGMGKALWSPEVRSVLVEVHFEKLENRGRAMAPVRIEKLLESSGFKRKWVDASHLFASR